MSRTSASSSTLLRKFGFWLVLIMLAAGGYWGWQQFGPGQQAQPAGRPAMGMRGGFMMEAVPVSVHQLEQGEFARTIKALGTVTAWNSTELTSQVSGILREVLFAEGQQVQQGDVLARLDDRSYQAALLQAEGALQETAAQLQQAEQDLRRYQNLIRDESIAKQTLEQQQAQVSQLRGTLKVREAQRDAARLDVEYSRITAPIAGRLGLRAVDVGNNVAAGSTVLATITQQQPIAVSFTLAEQYLPELLQALDSSEEPLPVEAWSRDEQRLLAAGVFDSMDNQVDANTGTVRLKARFTNEDNSLFPQQFVNVRLQLAVHDNVLKVPNDALQFGNQGRFVWVVDEELKARMRPVQTGLGGAEFTLVTSGLQAGERVVLEGVDRLKDGGKVEVIRADGSSEPAAQAPIVDGPDGAARRDNPAGRSPQ